jgi:hypothetical protein
VNSKEDFAHGSERKTSSRETQIKVGTAGQERDHIEGSRCEKLRTSCGNTVG